MTIYDRFYSIYGLVISIFYGMWVVITLSLHTPLWFSLVIPLPIMVVIYLVADFIRHMRKTKKSTISHLEEFDYPIHES